MAINKAYKSKGKQKKSPPKVNMEATNNEATIFTPNTGIKRRFTPIKQKGQYARPTQDAIKLSATYDVPPNEAYQIVTGREPHPTTLRNITQAVEKWSLRHPESLKAASKSIKAFASGKPVNGIMPKCSTILAAGQRIVDQSDPIIKRTENTNLNISTDLCPTDFKALFNRN